VVRTSSKRSWPGPESPASMPINRNTSKSGAPKRSASRLDRMPAITRTAPRRIGYADRIERSHEPPQIIANICINTCNCILIAATVRRQPISAASGNVPDLLALTRFTGVS